MFIASIDTKRLKCHCLVYKMCLTCLSYGVKRVMIGSTRSQHIANCLALRSYPQKNLTRRREALSPASISPGYSALAPEWPGWLKCVETGVGLMSWWYMELFCSSKMVTAGKEWAVSKRLFIFMFISIVWLIPLEGRHCYGKLTILFVDLDQTEYASIITLIAIKKFRTFWSKLPKGLLFINFH